VIWEAFKAESEPRRTIHRDEMIVVKPKAVQKRAVTSTSKGSVTSQPKDSDFLQKEGGIY
jgi:penicillin-binding protein 1A